MEEHGLDVKPSRRILGMSNRRAIRGKRLMKAFGRLYQRLDSTTSINLKVEALVQYFEETPPQDAAWG